MKKLLFSVVVLAAVAGWAVKYEDMGRNTEIVEIDPITKYTEPLGGIIFTNALGEAKTNDYNQTGAGLQWEDLSPYAQDPTLLVDMIGTNATAIDLINDPYAYERIIAVSDAAENGTNLIDAVAALATSGTDGIIVVDPGSYTLYKDLVISNATINLGCPQSPIISWRTINLTDAVSIQPEAPDIVPLATITGNLKIFPTATNSVIHGVKIVGDISAPYSTYTDLTNSSSSLVNCWVTGAVASNEFSALKLYGSFFSGGIGEVGGASTDVKWGGTVDGCIVLGDGSFYSMDDGWGKNGLAIVFNDTWIAATNSVQISAAGTVNLFFRNCRVSANGAFGGLCGVTAINTEFTGTPTSGWDSIATGARSRFEFCTGIFSNQDFSAITTIYCTDNNDVEMQ